MRVLGLRVHARCRSILDGTPIPKFPFATLRRSIRPSSRVRLSREGKRRETIRFHLVDYV